MSESRLRAQELQALGIDLEATLRESPAFLFDPRFLGALHFELFERQSAADARAALLQLGFLHGLRDATLVLETGFAIGAGPSAVGPTAPRLALRASALLPGPGGLECRGSWPEHVEADAVSEFRGADATLSCLVSAGYTSGWLSGILDLDLVAVEQDCIGAGHAACGFVVHEVADWARKPDAPEEVMALPFPTLRSVVAQHLEQRAAEDPQPPPDSFETGSPIVHIWGPVMVIPFAGPDESLRALDLIGRDPGAREVRVVVVDLTGALLDEGFGAVALEQILDAVESWGAEPLLAGVSPLSAPVVDALERTHGVLHKDLPEAIAVAFQIADAQRRVA